MISYSLAMQTSNNGLHTPFQAVARTSFIPGFAEEADSVYYEKSRGGEFTAPSKDKNWKMVSKGTAALV
jgi:hypothetical protein